MEISNKDFLMMQPGYPEVTNSDKFYYGVANELAKSIQESNFIKRFGDNIGKEVVLGVIGYYQDIVADSGIFRSFCSINNELYGKVLPIYDISEDYIESELNQVDVKFMVWYVTECCIEENGTISPFDKDIEEVSDILFQSLEKYYDMAPVSPDYCMAMDIDLHDESDIREIYDLSYWLFWNCYFMRHAAAPTMRMTLQKGQEILSKNKDTEKSRELLLELNQEAMREYPTGPLALFISEWLRAIVDNKSPFSKRPRKPMEPHKYYTSFTEATGGDTMKIFSSYDKLNDFLSNEMSWGEAGDGGHLPQVQDMNNFVLYVTPEKGMLIAPDIAQYINIPDNELYNKTEAIEDSISLITIQGRCPIDLVIYLFKHNMITDARFEWDNTGEVLLKDWDFFARLFLQSFYRAK